MTQRLDAIRLLVVEDNPADAELASEWLSDVPGHAFEIVIAPTLEGALQSEGDFDAVLLDLNLPDSHGVDTLRKLREGRGDVPVIVLSGIVDDETRRAAFEHGADDVIDKREPGAQAVPRSVLYAAELRRNRDGDRLIKALLSQATEPMVILNEEGTVRFSNPAADALVGEPLLEGQRIVVAADEGGSLELRAGGMAFRGERHIMNQLWGERTSNLVIIRDLSERMARRAAEAKAVAAEQHLELFKDVIESMPIGVRLMRRDADGGYQPEWENRVATAFWNDDLVPAAAVIGAACARAVELSVPQPLPDVRRSPDASQAVEVYSVLAAPLSRDLVGLFSEDITERASLTTQLQHAQKMEAVGRLAGGIAHDFNNLLTLIISFASLVREDIEDFTPAADDLDEVLAAAERAAELTRQLLAVSRRQPVAPGVVDMNELVIEAARILRRTIDADIEIVVIPGSEIWPTLLDGAQFEQVLMNLAINARDAMPHGGKITLETFNEAGRGSEPDCVVLRVSDTGVGMPPETRAQAFEPFFTTKPKGKGTGLGLAVVYGLINQARGSITVQSEPGHGTVFELRFPRTDTVASSDTKQPPTTPDVRGTETVLVVEDEPRLLAAVRRFLERNGYTVLGAMNGDEALRVFGQATTVDIVLTDVVMPGLTGPEFVAALRDAGTNLPVVFMTGYSSNVVPDGADTALGEHYWLEKPFTERQLLMRLRAVLDAHDTTELDDE